MSQSPFVPIISGFERGLVVSWMFPDRIFRVACAGKGAPNPNDVREARIDRRGHQPIVHDTSDQQLKFRRCPPSWRKPMALNPASDMTLSPGPGC